MEKEKRETTGRLNLTLTALEIRSAPSGRTVAGTPERGSERFEVTYSEIGTFALARKARKLESCTDG